MINLKKIPLVFTLILVCMTWFVYANNFNDKPSSSQHPQPPILYYVKNARSYMQPTCSKSSPEVFFNNIAEPSLSLLYHRCKAMFGILMDEIESSFKAAELTEDLKNKTREQWSFISKTVASSFDTAVDRLETEWEYFILVNDAVPLPWEIAHKMPIIYETVSRMEYGYVFVEAVIKAGVKEIAGTLQHQLVDVIKKLEDEVGNPEEITEMKLLKRMKSGILKMKSSFATKLLEKVVDKALEDQKKGTKKVFQQDTFVSESMSQMAIVMHAFREKGFLYPNFWSQMSSIYEMEYKVSSKTDVNEEVEKFLLDLMKNQDKLITLIVQIISRENK